MGFCRNCGMNIGTAGFCPQCGMSVIGDILAVQQQSIAAMTAEIRRQNLAEMQNIVEYFHKQEAVYNKVDALTREIRIRKEKRYYGWLIFTLLIAVPAFLMVNYGSDEGFVVRIILTAIFEIPALPSFLIYTNLKKKNKKQLEIAEKELDEACKFLGEYYTAYGGCPLGIKYTFPDKLTAIYNEMRDGKASTVEDALNSYLDRLHKEKVIEEIEDAKRKLDQIDENAQRAADYAELTYFSI